MASQAPPPRSSSEAPFPRSSSIKSSPSSSPSARSRRASLFRNPSPSRPTTATTIETSHVRLLKPTDTETPSNPTSSSFAPQLHHPSANSSVASLENILAMSLNRERSSSNASIGSKKEKSTIKAVLGAVSLERRRSSVVSNNNADGSTNSPDTSPQKDRQRKLHKQRASGDSGTNELDSGSDSERNRSSIPKRIDSMKNKLLGSIRRRKRSTGGSTSSIEEARGAVGRAGSPSREPSADLVEEPMQFTEASAQVAEVIAVKDAHKPISPVPEESGAIDLSTPPPAQTSFPNIEYPPISAAMQAAEAPVERSDAPAEARDSNTAITGSVVPSDSSPEDQTLIPVSLIPNDTATANVPDTGRETDEPKGVRDIPSPVHNAARVQPSQPMARDDTHLSDNHLTRPSETTTTSPIATEEDHHSDSDLVMVDSASEIEKRREASFIAAEHEVAKDREALPALKESESDGQVTSVDATASDEIDAPSKPSLGSVTIGRASDDFTPPITPADSTQFSDATNKDAVVPNTSTSNSSRQTAKLISEAPTELPPTGAPSLNEKPQITANEVPIPTTFSNQPNGKEVPQHSDLSGYLPSRDTLDTAAQYALFTAMTHLNNHDEEPNSSSNSIPLTILHKPTPQTTRPSFIPTYRSSASLRTMSSASSLNTLSIPLPRRHPDGQARVTTRPSIGQLESQTARRLPASVPIWIPIPKLPEMLEWSVRVVRYSAACSVTVVRLGSATVNTVFARIWRSLVFW